MRSYEKNAIIVQGLRYFIRVRTQIINNRCDVTGF